MAKADSYNIWKGSEKRLYRGEPVLRFFYTPRTTNYSQTSWAQWNYVDKVLAVNYWHEYPKALDSRKTTSRLNASLRSLLKPVRQMCVIENRVIKKDSTVLANLQYFAALEQCPTEEQMSELARLIETDVEFIAISQLVQERSDANAKKAAESYRNKQLHLNDED